MSSKTARVEVLVISLPRASARRALMGAQLEVPGAPPYRILDAVDGRALEAGAVEQLYDDEGARRETGRSLKPPQIGCAASHRAAYRYVVEHSLPMAVVLEDDALLGYKFPSVLEALSGAIDPSRPQVVLLSHVGRYSAWGGRRLDKIHRLYRPYEAWGAHGYLITRAGAQAMLEAFPRITVGADHWMHFARRGVIELQAVVPYVVGNSLFANDSQIGGDRFPPRFVRPLPRALYRYVWRKFLFQLLVRPALRLRRHESTW